MTDMFELHQRDRFRKACTLLDRAGGDFVRGVALNRDEYIVKKCRNSVLEKVKEAHKELTLFLEEENNDE